MSPLNAASCTTISYTLWVEWYYLKKTIIWPWGQRSRSHEGHNGMRHTALWSCTHIPNIIDLSGKTKNVMVRTSFAEKKQKKKKSDNNMSPFVRRGDIIRYIVFAISFSFILCDTRTTLTKSCHARVHIFNRSIDDELITKYLSIKTRVHTNSCCPYIKPSCIRLDG